MVSIDQKFAELIGKILGKRWFDKEQNRRPQHTQRQNHIISSDKDKSI